MTNFLSKKDIKLSKEFEKKGYIIRNIFNKSALKQIEKVFTQFIYKELKIKKKVSSKYLFNNINKFLTNRNLNSFRLKLINYINNKKDFKKFYYLIAKSYLDTLVGNELVMQNKINLSIQLPNDNSSLLPVHADVWSGDSPFEIVVWLPLVDCYKTKAMYILPPLKYQRFKKNFYKIAGKNSEFIFKKIKKDIKWINIKFGQVLIFDQSLPHGNRVNIEKETRWSMNCRFKSVFSPFGDKKIGEFFEHITLRKISELGMKYNLPKLNEKS
jgi:sporadic carbohydrate cluster 2OG-Fe(II) oxygenase